MTNQWLYCGAARQRYYPLPLITVSPPPFYGLLCIYFVVFLACGTQNFANLFSTHSLVSLISLQTCYIYLNNKRM